MDKNSTSFLVNSKLMKTFEDVLTKSPWCSPVPLKFESYDLHHWKNNCRKLVFLVFREQLLSHIIFGRLHYYEVTLVKKCNKTLLQESETKIFDQNIFVKTLLKASEKNNSDLSKINQIMSKLLTLSKRLHCSIILNMPSIFTIHILL